MPIQTLDMLTELGRAQTYSAGHVHLPQSGTAHARMAAKAAGSVLRYLAQRSGPCLLALPQEEASKSGWPCSTYASP